MREARKQQPDRVHRGSAGRDLGGASFIGRRPPAIRHRVPKSGFYNDAFPRIASHISPCLPPLQGPRQRRSTRRARPSSIASSRRCGSRMACRPTRSRPTGPTWSSTPAGWPAPMPRQASSIRTQAAAGARSIEASREADLLAYGVARHRAEQGQQQQPPPDGLQALLPMGLARRAHRRRPDAAPRQRAPAAAGARRRSARRRSMRCSPHPMSTRRSACATAPCSSCCMPAGCGSASWSGSQSVNLGLTEGALRVTGKGSRERLVPFGEEAHAWLVRYIARGAAGRSSAGSPATPVRHRPRRADDAPDVLEADQASMRCAPASMCRCRRTPCATPLPRTCSTMAPTCARCRCCSAMPTSRPRRSTPMWRASG